MQNEIRDLSLGQSLAVQAINLYKANVCVRQQCQLLLCKCLLTTYTKWLHVVKNVKQPRVLSNELSSRSCN